MFRFGSKNPTAVEKKREAQEKAAAERRKLENAKKQIKEIGVGVGQMSWSGHALGGWICSENGHLRQLGDYETGHIRHCLTDFIESRQRLREALAQETNPKVAAFISSEIARLDGKITHTIRALPPEMGGETFCLDEATPTEDLPIPACEPKLEETANLPRVGEY